MPRHEPPADLTDASKRRWPGLVADLGAATGKRPAEVDLLRLGDLLRIRDRLDAIAVKLAEDGVTVAGSTGQTQRHPLLELEAKLRAEFTAALKGLGLEVWANLWPDEKGRLKKAGRS